MGTVICLCVCMSLVTKYFMEYPSPRGGPADLHPQHPPPPRGAQCRLGGPDLTRGAAGSPQSRQPRSPFAASVSPLTFMDQTSVEVRQNNGLKYCCILYVNPLWTKFFFRRFSGYNLR